MVVVNQSVSPVFDTLPSVEQVENRLEIVTAERLALLALLKVLRQAPATKRPNYLAITANSSAR